MNIIQALDTAAPAGAARRAPPWKVLLLEPSAGLRQAIVHQLQGLELGGRGLYLLEASSQAQALDCLDAHPDLALALLAQGADGERDGLGLVRHIRQVRGNPMLRIILRLSDAGSAPQRSDIERLDIDDCRDAQDCSAQTLYLCVRLALKGYRDLQTIALNRQGLSHILSVTPDLYDLHRDKLEDYFRGVLMQLIGICKVGQSGLISTIDGMVMTVEGQDVCIRAGAGDFEEGVGNADRRAQIVDLCSKVVTGHAATEGLRAGAVVVPLAVGKAVFGFVYLESADDLSLSDRELIQVLANQCASSLQNFRLNHSLEESYEEAIDMLAQVAEYKDSATGSHIHRIEEYTRLLAQELGLPPHEVARFSRASRLHDIGKVGIPDELLRKRGSLSADEFETMKQHSTIGDAILKRSPAMALARLVARSHHEHWDGTGYPDGTAGAAIPFVARIVAVVDVFDALISHRPYKGPWLEDKAVAAVADGSGRHFDPAIAQAFLAIHARGGFAALIAAAHSASESITYAD